jgi:hypothetical protein
MLSFLLVFSLLERTPISLGLALDLSGPPNINSYILSSHSASSPSWIVPSVPPPEGSMELSRSTVKNLDLLFSISFRPKRSPPPASLAIQLFGNLLYAPFRPPLADAWITRSYVWISLVGVWDPCAAQITFDDLLLCSCYCLSHFCYII